MSGPERIGIPDGKPHPRQRHCAGAAMQLDRAGYHELAKNGIVWATPVDDIPTDGKGHARVSCERSEVTETRGTVTYTYALCRECSALESRFRKALRGTL